MRKLSDRNPLVCTVSVRLNRNCNLEIKTSAGHALEVLEGRTIFPVGDVTVFDRDGKKLTAADLTRIKRGKA